MKPQKRKAMVIYIRLIKTFNLMDVSRDFEALILKSIISNSAVSALKNVQNKKGVCIK
jgi:hypothetical protein